MATTSARILLAATALLLVTAMVPAASAQGVPGLTLTPTVQIKTPLKPVTESTDVTIDYVYKIPLSPLQLAALTGTVKLTLTLDCSPQDQLSISGSLSTLISITATDAGTIATGVYPGSLTITVSPKRTAPGLDQITCTVTGTTGALADPAVKAATPDSKTFVINTGVYSLIDYSVDLKLQQGGPQTEVPYSINVNNFGNARTKVIYSPQGDVPSGWTAITPDPLVLTSAQGTSPKGTSTFLISTPHKNGWNNDQAAFNFKLAPEAADDNTYKGSEGQITLVTRVRGVYVPTLEPFTMLAAVLGTALVLRMRREDEI